MPHLPKELASYIAAPGEEIDAGSVDLVFVDGRQRINCALAAAKLLKKGGYLMIHDFWPRFRYRARLPELRAHYDYLNEPRKFIPFTDNYFQRARQAIGVEDPAFIFYSNDPSWVGENYADEDIFLLDEPDEFVCLRAASWCEHFICSASSYSWWAAWLSLNPGKKVVIPSPWFGPDHGDPGTEHLRSPSDWIRVNPGDLSE